MVTLLIAAALAAPPSTTVHQARLIDADGQPINGTHSVVVSAYAAAADSEAVWSSSLSDVEFNDGYFATAIGPYDVHDFPSGVWVGVAVDGAPEFSRTVTNVVPYALKTDAIWPGIRLDAETRVAHNAQAGIVVDDVTAHGGQARQAQPGETGRLWGLHGSEYGGRFSSTPSRVTIRAKIADNSTDALVGRLWCSSQRNASWEKVGGYGVVRASDFHEADTWQDFTYDCAWSWDETNQFFGWDDVTDAGGALTIDYGRILPGAAASTPAPLPSQTTTASTTWATTWTSTDTLIPSRQSSFVKRHDETSLRVTWYDNWRCYGDQANCRVEMRFRPAGQTTWRSCAAPGPIYIDMYADTGTSEIVNHHDPSTVVGVCDALSGVDFDAGNWEMGPFVVENPHGGEGEFYIGWVGTRAVLEFEETYP